MKTATLSKTILLLVVVYCMYYYGVIALFNSLFKPMIQGVVDRNEGRKEGAGNS